MRERLIVSLESASPREALQLAERVSGQVGMFAVGRQLFLKGGPELIRELRHRGNEIFLDLKFHDEPRGVHRTAVEAARLGAKMFDLHPHCGSDVMEKVHHEVTRVCRSEGLRRPYILAVAIMTVLSRADQGRHETDDPAHSQVCRHARQAADASLDGVLTSFAQTAAVRATCGRRFTIVTSGVSLAPGAVLGPNTPGPAQAVRAGADYLIIGGALWEAQEPSRTLSFLAEEMERGLRSSPRNPLEFFSDRPHWS